MGRARQQMHSVLGSAARLRRRAVLTELDRFTYEVAERIAPVAALRLRGNAVAETLSDASATPVHLNLAARSPQAAQRAERRLRGVAVFDHNNDGRPRWELHSSALGMELVAVVRPVRESTTLAA